MRALRPFPFIAAVLIFLGCNKDKEDLKVEPIRDYFPLEVGNYITYRLDSTVFVQQGRVKETHYYEEKHLVDALITDNLGRPAYRMYRFIRDTSGTGPWTSSGSYMIVPQDYVLETVEDNFRMIRLTAPLKEGYSWRGNRYLPPDPFLPDYPFNNDNGETLKFWDFTVTGMGESLQLKNETVTDVVTVLQVDEEEPFISPTAPASRNYAIDKYAKGIGLVYQEYVIWEYVPNSGGTPYNIGFGVKRSMIDHN
jgi:hypothetical protein